MSTPNKATATRAIAALPQAERKALEERLDKGESPAIILEEAQRRLRQSGVIQHKKATPTHST